jgi:predicted permease
LQAIFRRNRLEAEMEAELACHLEQLTADLMRAGQSPAEAARNARMALGTALTHKEGMRGALGLRWWDELRADLRFGLRMLRKSPGFTLVAALSLALAIGANTAIFSMAKEFLYNRLGVPHPEQLRLLGWTGDDKMVSFGYSTYFNGQKYGMKSEGLSYPVFKQMQAHNRTLDGLFAFKGLSIIKGAVRGNALPLDGEMLSGNAYAVLGVRPLIGRGIQPSDDSESQPNTVAVISYGLWQREFGRSPQVLGQTITVNQVKLTIVGVNPRGFTGAQSTVISPDVFMPLNLQPLLTRRGDHEISFRSPDMWSLEVMGRMKPGVPESAVLANLDVEMAAATRASLSVPVDRSVPRLVLADGSRGVRQADGLVLLLACANIANLMLARRAHRQREVSVRLALGAGRGRVLRQMLTESLLLAGLGGVGGLLLGYVGRNALSWINAGPEMPQIDVHFDWSAFSFTAAITLLTGLLFGLAPAWSAARAEVSSNLKESGQTLTRRRRGLGGKALVGFQIALSTLLVIVAGLFARTVIGLKAVDPGFKADHLLLATIDPPENRSGAGKDVELHQQLEQAIGAVPGVESVSPMSMRYISGGMSMSPFMTEAESADPSKADGERPMVVGNRFFQTLGIPIVAGRSFGPQDTATSVKVGVINQSLARKRFPGVNPIGKRFASGDPAKPVWIQIVGICADTRYQTLREDPPPQFYLPYVQRDAVGSLTYAIRSHMPPTAITPALRRAVVQVDSNLSLAEVLTQQEQINRIMMAENILAGLTASFGVLALALACVGIYGVMAYSVANRRNEIGIRLALGALPAQVRGMILRESGWLAVSGIVVGVGLALALARLIKAMLYGIHPYDPTTVSAAVLLLLGVALAASWIPARRAASVEPMEALRHE